MPSSFSYTLTQLLLNTFICSQLLLQNTSSFVKSTLKILAPYCTFQPSTVSSAILSRTWKGQLISYCDFKRSCMPLLSSTVTGGVKQSPSWAMFTTKPIQALGQKVGVAIFSSL